MKEWGPDWLACVLTHSCIRRIDVLMTVQLWVVTLAMEGLETQSTSVDSTLSTGRAVAVESSDIPYHCMLTWYFWTK